MIDLIQKLLNPIKVKVHQLVTRGFITNVKQNNHSFSECQILFSHGGAQENIKKICDYGFTHYPYNKSEVLVLAPSGLRDYAIAVCVFDEKKQPSDLKPGEVAIYATNKNNEVKTKILLRPDGTLGIYANGKELIETINSTFNSLFHAISGGKTVDQTPLMFFGMPGDDPLKSFTQGGSHA